MKPALLQAVKNLGPFTQAMLTAGFQACQREIEDSIAHHEDAWPSLGPGGQDWPPSELVERIARACQAAKDEERAPLQQSGSGSSIDRWMTRTTTPRVVAAGDAGTVGRPPRARTDSGAPAERSIPPDVRVTGLFEACRSVLQLPAFLPSVRELAARMADEVARLPADEDASDEVVRQVLAGLSGTRPDSATPGNALDFRLAKHILVTLARGSVVSATEPLGSEALITARIKVFELLPLIRAQTLSGFEGPRTLIDLDTPELETLLGSLPAASQRDAGSFGQPDLKAWLKAEKQREPACTNDEAFLARLLEALWARTGTEIPAVELLAQRALVSVLAKDVRMNRFALHLAEAPGMGELGLNNAANVRPLIKGFMEQRLGQLCPEMDSAKTLNQWMNAWGAYRQSVDGEIKQLKSDGVMLEKQLAEACQACFREVVQALWVRLIEGHTTYF